MSLAALRRSYGTSKQLEQLGVWVKVPVDDPDVVFECLVARQSRANRAWATKISRAYKETKDKFEAGQVIDDESVENSIRIFAQTNLLDWRTNGVPGVKGDDGQMILYSPEVGYKYLDEWPDLYDFLNKVSLNKTFYQQVEQARIEKKSVTSSAGS